MNKRDFDVIIVGAGLSGSVIARRFADAGKKVLMLEKRNVIGGNVYDKKIDGITVQPYGPHIFHTNNERVMKFVNQFTKLAPFKNKPSVFVAGATVPLPFNFRGIDRFWPEETTEIQDKLLKRYEEGARVPITELIAQEDEQLKEVADFIFTNIFANYTSKMWDIDIADVDPAIVNRVPIKIGYGEGYFSDKYEGIPNHGFTDMIKNMIDHKNIDIKLGVDARDFLEIDGTSIYYDELIVKEPIVFTGDLSHFFDEVHGPLEYRSLEMTLREYIKDEHQVSAVVNHPAHPNMTRTTEFKKLYNENIKGITYVLEERPGQYQPGDDSFGEPYYPVTSKEENIKTFEKYKAEADKLGFHLVGRLATYQYINMDRAIELALEAADELLK